MTKYRGYYIDHVVFNTKADIDAFCKDNAVKAYKQAVEMFAKHPDMEHSIYCTEKARVLMNEFDFSGTEVEAIECEVFASVA